MEITKKIIGLLKEAIKTKSSIKSVLEKDGLGSGYVGNFIRRTPVSANKKDVVEIKNLYKKHQALLKATKGSNVVSESELEEVKKIYYDKTLSWDERMNLLVKKFGKGERTIRRWLVDLGLKEKNVEESEQWKKAQVKKHNGKKKRFIITSAQNETPVHKGFLSNIEAYAKYIDAEILVVPLRYRNPTSVFTDEVHDVWPIELEKYLCANRLELHKHITLLGDIKVQPTSSNPLTGLESITGEESCIVGSPRIHMLTVPVIDSHKPKLMLTTGTVSERNYTDSKTGKTSEFHHTYGALILEIQDTNVFHARQVTAEDNGDFQDLFLSIKKGKVSKIKESAAIVPGDIHLGETDEVVMNGTFDLMKKINPKHIFLHDLFTAYSINPHEAHNVFKLIERHKNNTNSLKVEIDSMLSWLGELKKKYKGKVVVVKSNHDDMLDRFIINCDFKKDIGNAVEYLKLANILASGNASKGLVPHLINEKYPDIITLGLDDSFKVMGYECGIHSHIGSSGTRGSIQQYRKLNFKCIIGHGHSPKRLDGAVMTGVSTPLRVSYNHGPSGWLNSAVILHNNGKCQIINFIEGEYTTLK